MKQDYNADTYNEIQTFLEAHNDRVDSMRLHEGRPVPSDQYAVVQKFIGTFLHDIGDMDKAVINLCLMKPELQPQSYLLVNLLVTVVSAYLPQRHVAKTYHFYDRMNFFVPLLPHYILMMNKCMLQDYRQLKKAPIHDAIQQYHLASKYSVTFANDVNKRYHKLINHYKHMINAHLKTDSKLTLPQAHMLLDAYSQWQRGSLRNINYLVDFINSHPIEDVDEAYNIMNMLDNLHGTIKHRMGAKVTDLTDKCFTRIKKDK